MTTIQIVAGIGMIAVFAMMTFTVISMSRHSYTKK